MTDINELIRKAEMQQRQMALELMFKRNMELFKKFAPQIYNDYISYTPKRLRLSLDPNQQINLINMDSGTYVYQENPDEFCQKQIDFFEERPGFYKVNFSAPTEKYFFQLPLISKVLHKFDCFRALKPSLDNPIGVLVINGCGLGYHIGKLVNKLDVRNLVIFDPHKDSFYASLHTIDWAPIVEYFCRPGHMLKFFLGMDDKDTMIALRLMTNRVGQHNIANTYVYNHLSSQETEAFTQTLFKQFHLTLTGTGFLEDEQVSFAHTCDNLSRNIPVLNNSQPQQKLPPVFIVGNGPSLDHLLPFLKKNLNNAIIFSCGSSTGTLYREGITPDFHIEMERTGSTTARIRNGTDKEYRDKVRLLALNTVAPGSMDLFPTRYMAKKTNDPGEHMIDQVFGQSMPSLNICNPTCTNTGLAFALHMGFKEIYLLGVDLGMKDKEKHHASSSQYYEKDEEKRPNFGSSERRVNIEVEGNFGGTVFTTAILDTSRANMVLSARMNPQAKIYNLNDGAKIEGTIPLPVEDTALDTLADKNHYIELLEKTCFSSQEKPEEYTEKSAKNKFLTEFFNFRKHLSLPQKINNAAEIQTALDDIHDKILRFKNTAPVTYWILNGSIQSFSTIIIRACLIATSEEELQENYQFVKSVYDEFVKRGYALFRDECLTHHTMNKEYNFD